MKKVIILATFIVLATLMNFGCATKLSKWPPVETPKAHPSDANKDGNIDLKDISFLDDLSENMYEEKIVPYMDKANIESLAELLSPEGHSKLRRYLTVVDFDTLMYNYKEWDIIKAQIKETMIYIQKKDDNLPPLIQLSGKVAGCHIWGGVELSNGIVIKYAGIKIPSSGGATNKYLRFTALYSSTLITGRIIKYGLTGNKVGNIPEAYIYLNDVCINEILVKRGYAIAVRDESKMSERLVKLEDKARENKMGLWAFSEDNPFAEPLY